jgi:FtsP/CotA-like multicopper oxidase with cupredoxin domain
VRRVESVNHAGGGFFFVAGRAFGGFALLDRRRFIVSSISVAAVATAIATDACSSGNGLSVSSLIPEGASIRAAARKAYVLNVQYAITNIKGYRLRGRTYNGRTIGPTMRISGGDTLAVRIINKLPPNPPVTQPKGEYLVPIIDNMMQAMDRMPHHGVRPSDSIDPMNNPHGFNTTNLHTHGIQTVPHLFDPVGTSNPAADLIQIKPGQQFQYALPIPKDHPSGLHWYHPHNHGSTDVQVSNGMAGLIVVDGPIDEVPEIKAARQIFMVIQTLDVNKNEKTGVYEREYIAYRSPANGGYSFSTTNTMYTVNGEAAYWAVNKPSRSFKQLGIQSYNVAPGEVIRLRLLNGTNYFPLMLALPGFETYVIGFDGVNTLKPIPTPMTGKGVKVITPENMLDAPIRFAFPANRIEFLIKAPAKPGTYTLSSLAQSKIFDDFPTLDFAQFVVSGKPVNMSIPSTLPVPTREYPLIAPSDVKTKRKFVFDQGSRTDLLMGFGFTVNGKLYQMDECPTAPQVGTCEEWRIENATEEAHPFHLHENSFQIVAVNDKPNTPVEIWDTFVIPPKAHGKNGSITIRIRFLQWYGKTVFHCHILPHEDTGMMQNILMV